MQPPLRGCVLKLEDLNQCEIAPGAAASARLCVETLKSWSCNGRADCSRLCAAVC